jgi:hypothetical protein
MWNNVQHSYRPEGKPRGLFCAFCPQRGLLVKQHADLPFVGDSPEALLAGMQEEGLGGSLNDAKDSIGYSGFVASTAQEVVGFWHYEVRPISWGTYMAELQKRDAADRADLERFGLSPL